MNLFADSVGDPSNNTELLFNLTSGLPSFNGTFLDFGNFSSINGKHCLWCCNSMSPFACRMERERESLILPLISL